MKILTVMFLSIVLFTGCQNMEDKVDNLFKDYNRPGLPGAAVMVIKNGKVILQKGYGLADIEKNKHITSSTNFRLASVTKQFTAMCILMLIERDSLEFETTLTELFPDFPEYGNVITVKHLLQHTSGLKDYEDMIDDTVTVQLKDKDVLDRMMKTDKTYFETGSQHRYSNTGFALLALIVEKISGMAFRDFLEKNIFNPLGMDNTLAYENGINEVENRAYGYTVSSDKAELTDQSLTSAVLGDGGIYSSLDDLYKWDQSLYTNRLINQGYLEESWTKGVACEGTIFSYGYAWHIGKWKDSKAVYHTGSTMGFRNIIYRIPEKKFTVLILTNRNSGEESVTLDLAQKITDWYLTD